MFDPQKGHRRGEKGIEIVKPPNLDTLNPFSTYSRASVLPFEQKNCKPPKIGVEMGLPITILVPQS